MRLFRRINSKPYYLAFINILWEWNKASKPEFGLRIKFGTRWIGTYFRIRPLPYRLKCTPPQQAVIFDGLCWGVDDTGN